MADLSEKMGLSLSANPEVLERICMNERIAYDNGRLCYKVFSFILLINSHSPPST